MLGGAAIPMSTKVKQSELSYFIEDSKAEIVVCGEQYYTHCKNAIEDTSSAQRAKTKLVVYELKLHTL